jgi:hypothetical protein
LSTLPSGAQLSFVKPSGVIARREGGCNDLSYLTKPMKNRKAATFLGATDEKK